MNLTQRGSFDTAFSQTAPCSFCRPPISVTHGSSPKEQQSDRPLEPKPSVAKLPRLPSPVAVSSSLSPAPVRPIPLTFFLGAATDQPQGGPAELDQLSVTPRPDHLRTAA